VLTGIEILKDYPVFGTGFGTYGSAASLISSPEIYKTYNIFKNFYADNQYICILVETGIVGTIIALSFLISLFILYRKNYFVIIMFIIILWTGLFYNVFEIQIISLLFWTTLAINESKRKHMLCIKNLNNER
jgi:O-antigen ligase